MGRRCPPGLFIGTPCSNAAGPPSSSPTQDSGLSKGQAANLPLMSPAGVDLRPSLARNAGFDTSLVSNRAFRRGSLVALYEIISI